MKNCLIEFVDVVKKYQSGDSVLIALNSISFKIKYGEFPTKADIDRGLKRFTFNFDFVRRNAKRKENFTNQDINEKAIKKEIKKKVSQKTDELVEKLDIQVD